MILRICWLRHWIPSTILYNMQNWKDRRWNKTFSQNSQWAFHTFGFDGDDMYATCLDPMSWCDVCEGRKKLKYHVSQKVRNWVEVSTKRKYERIWISRNHQNITQLIPTKNWSNWVNTHYKWWGEWWSMMHDGWQITMKYPIMWKHTFSWN